MEEFQERGTCTH